MKDDDLDLDTVTLTVDETIDDLILSDYSMSGSSSMIDTITIDSGSTIDTITLDPSYYSSNIGNITLPPLSSINSVGTSTYSTITGSGMYTGSTVNITNNGIDMQSSADIKIGERSLKEFMEKMEERMAILVPDPAKLEKFAALKKAYENYKLMEKLCQEDEDITK